MQTKHLSVLIHIWTEGEVGAPLNRFKPSSRIFLPTIPRRCIFCGSFMLFLSCFLILSCASVWWCLVVNCWEKADPSFVMSNCDVVSLESWVRYGAWLYRFLIVALCFTLKLLSFPWKNSMFLETFSLAIFIGNSSLRLAEVLVSFLPTELKALGVRRPTINIFKHLFL